MSRWGWPSLLACLLAAQAVGGATAFTVVDDVGRSVVIHGPPDRIVALAPSNTEILFALGAEDRIVAVDQWSDHPPAAKAKPRIPPFSPSLEQIVKLRPDLILAAHGSAEPVLPLARQGVKILVLAPRTLDDIYRNILLIGRLVGAEERAQGLVDGMRRRVAEVLAKVRGAPRPRVFVELDGSDPNRPYTAGRGSFVDLLVRLAGGANVAASSRTAWPQFSLEELLKTDPDMIILAHELIATRRQTAQTVARRAGWHHLRAVREGAIHPIDGELLSRPGPRIVEGLEWLARRFHADRFR
jgi:iron complex transport system substrate-binding protein